MVLRADGAHHALQPAGVHAPTQERFLHFNHETGALVSADSPRQQVVDIGDWLATSSVIRGHSVEQQQCRKRLLSPRAKARFMATEAVGTQWRDDSDAEETQPPVMRARPLHEVLALHPRRRPATHQGRGRGRSQTGGRRRPMEPSSESDTSVTGTDDTTVSSERWQDRQQQPRWRRRSCSRSGSRAGSRRTGRHGGSRSSSRQSRQPRRASRENSPRPHHRRQHRSNDHHNTSSTRSDDSQASEHQPQQRPTRHADSRPDTTQRGDTASTNDGPGEVDDRWATAKRPAGSSTVADSDGEAVAALRFLVDQERARADRLERALLRLMLADPAAGVKERLGQLP